ncbi:MAG: serine hydrolase [Oscillospiraceae bacterium]
MNGMLKKVVGMSMAVVMAATATVLPAKLPGIKAIAQPQCPVTVLDAAPAGQWQDEVNFPDWANYVDDTLIMNSLYSFTGFADQGSVYVTASEGITGMELFINGTRVDASSILENPGKAVQVDYAAVAKNGTNTIQVTNITPSNAKVNVKIPTQMIDGTPAEVGMEEDTLQLIDDLINSEVKYGFSAAQLAVIKDGKMVVNEAWGNVNGWTRDGEMDKTSAPVTTDTLFDLASNTKMYATNYAVQKLVSEGKLNVDAKVRDYIPNFKDGANDKIKGKDNLTIAILQHQAGFPADRSTTGPPRCSARNAQILERS